MRILDGLVGLAGLGLAVFFAALVAKVLHSPADDNPIVLLFCLATLFSLIPGSGVLWAMVGRKLDGLVGWSWLAASLLVLAPLGLLAFTFR